MDVRFKWLARYLAESWRWVFRNPTVIILILILVSFNYFASSKELDALSDSKLDGNFIYNSLVGLAQSLSHFPVLLASIAGTLLASAITVFEMAAMFALFQGRPHPFAYGLRVSFSFATIKFMAVYGIFFGLYGIFGLSVSYLVVVVLGMGGIYGAVVLMTVIALTFPILYMLLSVAAMLAIAPLMWAEFRRAIHEVLSPVNFSKLSMFYGLRIGVELIILLPLAAAANYIGLSVIWSAAIIIIAITLPFTLMRTTGFIIKLDALRPVSWFKNSFELYYEGNDGKVRATS